MAGFLFVVHTGDHTSGQIKIGSHSGPPRYLSDAEEQVYLPVRPYGICENQKKNLAMVKVILASKGYNGNNVHPSNG